VAVDLEALEIAMTERLLAVINPTTGDPAVRSVFNVVDESMATDERGHQLPAVGILFSEETWEDNELLGESDAVLGQNAIAKVGRVSWKLFYFVDAAKYGSGMRGPRGAYKGSGLIQDDIDGWQIIDGCPLQVHGRSRYDPRNEDGEFIPLGGIVIDASHEATFVKT
jgi:hypothetical protein